MQSFNNTTAATKQNLSYIIQKLGCANFTDLIKNSSAVSTATPHWMSWLFFQHPSSYSIKELLHDYAELEKPDAFIIANQQLGLSSKEEKEKLHYAIELGKLAIKIAALNSLPALDKSPATPPDNPGIFKKLCKKILYWVLFPIGTLIAAFQGMDGVKSLLEILGLSISISAWPVVICSILGVVCACALYYAFEMEFLKEKLELTNDKNLQSTLNIYEKQIDVTTQIENNLLITADKIHSTKEFSHYVKLCKKFHAQITSINNTIHCYQENVLKKIARYCIMKAGIILAIGDTLYTVIGVIGGTALSSNPISILCCIVLAIGAAIFFIASYVDQVYEKINGTAKQINVTKEKAASYCHAHLLDFLQEKLKFKEGIKKSRENNFALQCQIKAQSQKITEQQADTQKQQKELELWQLWRKARHSRPIPFVAFVPIENKTEQKRMFSRRRSVSLLSITNNPDKNPAASHFLSRRKSI